MHSSPNHHLVGGAHPASRHRSCDPCNSYGPCSDLAGAPLQPIDPFGWLRGGSMGTQEIDPVGWVFGL